jgi:hypothetical protein
MTARFATQDEIADWNTHIVKNPNGGNIFSSYQYARQKETGGYTARFIIIDTLAVTVLEKKALGIGTLWYLPKGPGVTSTKDLLSVLEALTPLARRYRVFAIRVESELARSTSPTLARHGLMKAQAIIPNPSTITLDITPSLDDILTTLPQKGRYAINRAQRDGVSCARVPATDENIAVMFELFRQTAEGQFGIRSFDYYRTFWQRFEAAGLGQLFFAYVDGHVVAGAYAMVLGTKSTYKDGASVRKRTVYGASHLLQWEVITWAKEHGSLIHDFCGSPPSEDIDNPEHPHHGIGLFKTAFNRTVTDYIGCYDFVLNQALYTAWTTIGERIVRRVHRYKHHDSYY